MNELEFNIHELVNNRMDSVVEIYSLFITIQFAIFVAIYYFREHRTRFLDIAMFGLYNLAFFLSLAKIKLDYEYIGAIYRQLAEMENLSSASQWILKESGESFGPMFYIMFGLCWLATAYLVFFFKIDASSTTDEN